jgi:cytochrome P450
MTSLIQYEPRVNETVRVFLKQTEALYATPGNVCNFILWLQYFAFDVITEITYSRRVGFVDNCEDVDGIIAWLTKIFDYQAPVGQMPWLDKLFVKNPIRTLLSKYGYIDNSSGTAKFSRARMAERLQEMEAKKASGKDEMETDSMDLLNMFLKAQKRDPAFFDDGRLLTMTTSIALAGSDTTAIALAAVFYNLLKNPRCYEKLNAEIDSAVESGLISNEGGIITWSDAQKLPYLHACIQETFRVHPSIGLILERLTPPQGLEVAGNFIPGGTIVGCTSWVLHQRREIFGDDVEVYRPERWMSEGTVDDETHQLRLKEMNNVLFHFGGGSRTCLGKHIALLEMYKVIPSFLRRFEVSQYPATHWLS